MAETYRQYERACRTESMQNYEVSGREYDEAYPPGSRLREWIDDTLSEARRGVILPVTVLDDLVTREPGTLSDLRRDYRVTLPPNYEPPEVRRTPEYQRWLRWSRRPARQLADSDRR